VHEQEEVTRADAEEVADGPTETRRSLPPEDGDNGSDDDDNFDVTSTSSVSIDSHDGVHRNGSVRRVPEPINSLAGKRHTKVVLNPPSSNSAGAAFIANLSPPGGGAGGLNSRAAGAGGRRGAPSSSLAGNASGGGASNGGHHHAGDGTLRYRTDLDKQVIHFMFERYHQEQICCTSSAVPTAGTDTDAEASNSAAEERPAEANRETTNSIATTHNGSPPRTRRIAVEEIYVPANGEGDDKHIGLGDWHFFWMHVGRVRHTICSSDFRWQDQQIINHFPDHAELTRKDLMYKNIKRYLREHQANNYARLTLYTATDWVSAAANATSTAPIAAAKGSTSAAGSGEGCFNGTGSVNTLGAAHGLTTKAFCFADSVPITYNIPNDMSMFKEECQKQRGTQWIVKPTSRSQGKGIFIIDDVRALQRWVKEKKDTENMASFLATGPANRASWVAPSVLQQQRAAQQSALEAAMTGNQNNSSSNNNGTVPHLTGSPTSPTATAGGGGGPSSAITSTTTGGNFPSNNSGGMGAYIVSKYISNPLLIGGKKFDLRLYVLVTSYKPLVAYLHEDGFARFCATRYNASSLAQEDLGSHLTNVALQKGDEHYNTSHGGKWSFQNLFLYVQARYGPYAAEGMMQNIQFLIYHSLKAVEPVMFNDKHSFELYGYDILLDDHINPHLIEVNASPSMSTTTVSDRLLKEQVLTDTMKIIFPPGFPVHNKTMPYWEYRQRTDLTTQQQTGFKLLQF
jgi:hypothetical protein